MKNTLISLFLLLVWIGGVALNLSGQNIPPLIGDKVGKPKVSIPNPLGKQGPQKSQESNQNSPTSAQEADVRNFLNGFVNSLISKNLEKVSACYLPEPALVVYWESQELRGWETVQAEWQKVLQNLEGFKMTLKDLNIHIFGRFAWATANYQREGVEAGKPVTQEGRVTYVLERKRASWYILHEHASARVN